MGKKKGRVKSGKRVARRVTEGEEARPKPKKQVSAPVEEEKKPRITERIQEKDAGFGVIKVMIGVIVVLILAAGAFSRLVEDDDDLRGDKVQGDPCGRTDECQSGMVCRSYQDSPKQCLKLCEADDACDEGYACVTATRPGRKKTTLKKVCVKGAK